MKKEVECLFLEGPCEEQSNTTVRALLNECKGLGRLWGLLNCEAACLFKSGNSDCICYLTKYG